MFFDLNQSSQSCAIDFEDDTESRIAEVRSEILRIQADRKSEILKYEQAMEAESCKLKELSKLYDQRSKAFFRDVSIRRYAPFVKANDIPSCVHVLQASQLRSLHQLCVLDYQKRLVEEHSSDMIAELRRAMLQLGEEKTQVDLQMLNTMARVQSEEHEMHQSYESILSEQNAQLEFFQDVVQGIEMERSMDGGFDDLIDHTESDSVAALKDASATTASTWCSIPGMQQLAPPNPAPSPMTSRRTRRTKLSLGEMLQKGSSDRQLSSFQSSTTSCSEDGSVSSFLSQSFSKTVWKERTNKVEVI